MWFLSFLLVRLNTRRSSKEWVRVALGISTSAGGVVQSPCARAFRSVARQLLSGSNEAPRSAVGSLAPSRHRPFHICLSSPPLGHGDPEALSLRRVPCHAERLLLSVDREVLADARVCRPLSLWTRQLPLAWCLHDMDPGLGRDLGFVELTSFNGDSWFATVFVS